MRFAELYEFVTLPERKTFTRKQFAKCLAKFGEFYHLLYKNALPTGKMTRESMRALVNIVDDVEDACYIDLSDVKPKIEEAYRWYLRDEEGVAKDHLVSALAKIIDGLRLMGWE